jgi:hypothetical protein
MSCLARGIMVECQLDPLPFTVIGLKELAGCLLHSFDV